LVGLLVLLVDAVLGDGREADAADQPERVLAADAALGDRDVRLDEEVVLVERERVGVDGLKPGLGLGATEVADAEPHALERLVHHRRRGHAGPEVFTQDKRLDPAV
jgi:hypothetical protein